MGDQLSKIFVDPKELPNTFGGFVQLLSLLGVYGYILSKGSNMISDGSELLLLVPSLAGIVGSVVLPVLGAVPDGAIVLFSGLGDNAQEQLSVGVGALAGSTIMLLTIPWAMCLVAGRVNLDAQGNGIYTRPKDADKDWVKVSPPGNCSLTGTGVTVKRAIRINGRIMLFTSLAYLIIQGPAFAYDCAKSADDCEKSGEKWWAFGGLMFCVVNFIAYLWWQVHTNENDAEREGKLDQVIVNEIKNKHISISVAFAEVLQEAASASQAGSSNALLTKEKLEKRFGKTLHVFFKMYDINGDGVIDESELIVLFRDLGETVNKDTVQEMMSKIDLNHDGTISFDEFEKACFMWIQNKHTKFLQSAGKGELRKRSTAANRSEAGSAGASPASATRTSTSAPGSPNSARAAGSQQVINQTDENKGHHWESENHGEEDEEEEEVEVPDDLTSLPPDQQLRRIKMRSAWMMGLGTLMVLLFSDPMVDVLSELGNRINVGPFYVAFVLAPLASNASELIASYNYALKKTKASITISFAALEGAACMNNTFCLGLFLALVFFRGLAWEFAAETLAILMVELCMFTVTLLSTQKLFWFIVVLTFYPLSIAFVVVLEQVGLN